MPIEERLQALLAAGQASEAVAEGLREVGPVTLRYLRSLLHDEDEAADAFSVFAENFWRGLPGFRFGSSLRTWSYRIAWNAAQNLRNAAWKRHGRRFASGEASAIAEEIRTRSAEGVSRQRSALDRIRDSLPDEDRSLLALRIDQGLSWAEIAEILSEEGRPVQANTVTKRFERLKSRLAELADQHGLEE